MEIIGAVAAILDETKVLLKLTSNSYVGADLTVFSEIKEPKIGDLGLERLLIPKGDIHVVLFQGNDIYLAERFQAERIEKRRKPSNFMLNPLSQFFEEEVEVVTKGAWSASFDKSQSLKIEYPKEIQVGDIVGIK